MVLKISMTACQSCFCICELPCDPLAQDCPGDDLCIPYASAFMCVLDASGEEGQVGDGCNYANACEAGNACGDPAGLPEGSCDLSVSGCCTAICDLNSDECPELVPGTQCSPVYDPPFPGFEHVGLCALP